MRLTQSQVYAVAVASGLPNPKLMAAIAMAESGGDTNAVNSIGCVGLWQINQPAHVKAHPTWTREWLKNPLNNAAAAKIILKQQGLGAWEVYTGPDGKGSDGTYTDFVDKPVNTATQVWDFWDPLDILPDDKQKNLPFGDLEIPGPMDALDGVTDAIGRTADVLVNPRTWLRVAYGITGVVLVVGGLLLILRRTPMVTEATEAAETAINATPVGAAATTAKNAVKGAKK